jgi:hypothetical protein
MKKRGSMLFKAARICSDCIVVAGIRDGLIAIRPSVPANVGSFSVAQSLPLNYYQRAAVIANLRTQGAEQPL